MARPTPKRIVSIERNLPSARNRKTPSTVPAHDPPNDAEVTFPFSTPHSAPGAAKIQTLVISVPRIATPRSTSSNGKRPACPASPETEAAVTAVAGGFPRVRVCVSVTSPPSPGAPFHTMIGSGRSPFFVRDDEKRLHRSMQRRFYQAVT